MDHAIDLVAFMVLAFVTRCGDDDDAGIDQFFDLYADRVVRVRIYRERAKAQIDDADIMRLSVLQDPVQTAEKPRGLAGTIIAQDFYADNIGIVCNTAICAIAVALVSNRETRNVRAVAESIICRGRVREIHICYYSRGAVAVLETVVGCVDAGIQNCHADP